MARKTPSYQGLKPASENASKAARGSSKKADTKPEVLLRKALWKAGLRYRKNVKDLPGKPDIVFPRAKVAIFVDGDFWHGRNWDTRKEKLEGGSNPKYWTTKIAANILRDDVTDNCLRNMGWFVFRFWESDISTKVSALVGSVYQRLLSCDATFD